MYPRIGGASATPPPTRPAPPLRHPTNPSTSVPSSGVGIKVRLKPEYHIGHVPQLIPQLSEVPHSTFEYDFGFEKKVLAEAEKEIPDWSRVSTASQLPKASSSAYSGKERISMPKLSTSLYGANET